jgi:hypothetical protein
VIESLVVLLGVSLLGGLAWLVAALAPLTLLWCSGIVIGLGIALGLPGGVVYHVLLRRELLRLAALGPGWIWRPTAFHGALDEPGLARVRPWFLVGGSGFGLIVLGTALLVVTMVTHFR